MMELRRQQLIYISFILLGAVLVPHIVNSIVGDAVILALFLWFLLAIGLGAVVARWWALFLAPVPYPLAFLSIIASVGGFGEGGVVFVLLLWMGATIIWLLGITAGVFVRRQVFRSS